MRKATISMMALAAVVLTAGCKGGPGGPNYPAWVNDSGASRADYGEVIYGVGSVSNVNNASLARRTSDSRARREVASTLRVNVQGVLKDYMKSVSDGNPEDNEEGQVIEDVARTIVDEVLIGCQVVDRYIDNSTTPPTFGCRSSSRSSGVSRVPATSSMTGPSAIRMAPRRSPRCPARASRRLQQHHAAFIDAWCHLEDHARIAKVDGVDDGCAAALCLLPLLGDDGHLVAHLQRGRLVIQHHERGR